MSPRWIGSLLLAAVLVVAPGSFAAPHPAAARETGPRPFGSLQWSGASPEPAARFLHSPDLGGLRPASAPAEARRLGLDAPGDENWADLFTPRGTNGAIYSVAVDESGILYVGGDFTAAGGVPANYVARWDGSAWSALGSGTNGIVAALAIDWRGWLYAGGAFTSAGGVPANYVARWDGSTWSTLGTGMNDSVLALAYNGLGGIYAGGSFTTAGGVPANYVAEWDGSEWSALGSGLGGDYYPVVSGLAPYTSGCLLGLYVGGTFTTAGGEPAQYVARWDGSSWSALGNGIGGGYNTGVWAVAADDDENLYAGGYFNSAGEVEAHSIARWDGSAWSALGSGMGGLWPTVYGLAVGGGGELYAGGSFGTAGDVEANSIARWDGSAWSALGSGVNGGTVMELAVDGGGGLFAGGWFSTAHDVPVSNVARWDGSGWSALGDGQGMSGDAGPMVLDADGSLYAGGTFAGAGGVLANGIARWDGSTWSALGGGVSGGPYTGVYALALEGEANLYAGGEFTHAGGLPVNAIARWDGSAWSALGDGVDNRVDALALGGDGCLYAGGSFTTAGGVAVNNIARWDGTAWSDVGGGVDAAVKALAPDGKGGVYVGGYFTYAGDVPAYFIAHWDGSEWRALGSGMNTYAVLALAVDRAGNLYAGGTFTAAGGVPANYIARWDGLTWSALGSGVGDGVNYTWVSALVVDSRGYVCAGGSFTTAGGVPANNIACWDGSAWSALGSGTDGPVGGLLPNGRDVYAGGGFLTAGGKPSFHFAWWRPPNQAPVAQEDAYATPLNTPLLIAEPGVLANDSDPDGDPLTPVLDTGPWHGTLELGSDGAFLYTPAAHFVGVDTFSYHATDGPADSNTATVEITVTGQVLFLPLAMRGF